MAKDKNIEIDVLDSAISLFKELNPVEQERALGIIQGMLISKGKSIKDVFPKKIA